MAVQGGYMTVGGSYVHGVGSRDANASEKDWKRSTITHSHEKRCPNGDA